jgi:hypothetical protein
MPRTAPLCGKPLSPEDGKVWRQAIALLMGLKFRNEFGDKDLTAAVGMALRRGETKRKKSKKCEDCGVKVARGAAYSGAQGGGVNGARVDRSLVPWPGGS